MRARWLALLILASVVAITAVLDRDVTRDARPPFGHAHETPMPIADAEDVLASTWYCAAGTASEGGPANLTVVIANTSDSDADGTVTWYVPDRGPIATPVEVPARGTASLVATKYIDSPVVSAIVDVRGGGIAVEHVVSGSRGSSVAPCASDASPTWYFANGTTERDAVEVIALFNPFPDDAIVDISFSTDEGRADPAALTGLPVAANTTRLVNVHDHVRRRAVTATSIVARSGRVVADRIQSFDASLGRRGVSLALGAPAAADAWTFPEGQWSDGLSQQWHVYNPSDREAEVDLELVPAEGDPIEPIALTIPARTQVVVDAAESERIPAGVVHSSAVVSLNGVPIVAERSLDARPPAPRRGWASSLGAPLAARSWVLPFGEVSSSTDEWVIVHNPNAQAVAVSVSALAGGQLLAVEGLHDLSISPGGRIALRIGDHIQRSPLPLLVVADGEVVVERDLYRVGATGLSTVMGIPLTT